MNFTDLVEQIRIDRNATSEVPAFDPANGNERARLLLLMEAPGPRAVGSGIVSFDNPDPSARNLKVQLERANIARDDIALWNIVPWYIGTGARIRAAATSDIIESRQYLPPLLSAMPNLRCVFLIGGAARKAHIFLSRLTVARIVTCHHSSNRVQIANSEAAQENVAIFTFVRSTL